MKREPLPFYPLVVASLPVVSVFAANLAYVPASQVVRPLAVALAGVALLTLVLGLILRSAARGAAAAAAVAICVFGYGWFESLFYRAVDGIFKPLPAWGVGTAVLAGLAAWGGRRTRPLNVLAAFVALLSLANLGFGLVRSARLAARAPRADLSAAKDGGVKPDVFYVILDGHGRTDSLRRAIGVDDSAFVAGLRKRGFFVADESHSNYCQTELSLASSLNMDTIPSLLPKVDPSTIERAPLAGLADDNEVARRFRAQGYRFVAVTSGFPPLRFTSADLRIGGRWGGSMVESTLLAMTPFARGEADIGSQFDSRRRNLLDAFGNLGSLGVPAAAPRLVVAHVLAPHPPFVFRADGSPQRQVGAYGYWDGDDYTTFAGGTQADYRRGYAGQAAWADAKTLEAIDRIRAAADPARPPIIIVQGDHGSKVGLAQNSLAKTDLHECFPILNAYLVPPAVRKDLRPTITPINSFRVLLRDLFGDELPDLPDRSWYSGYATPYAFTDVTDRIEPVR